MTGAVEREVAAAISSLAAVIEADAPRLRALGEERASACPPGMRWSRKQLIGHLIDSATNNHQRFVRAQRQARMSFPPYAQEEWVAAEAPGERPWEELVELWRLYNRHLLHLMRRVPAAAFHNECLVSDDEPSRLADHMIDYVRHLRHHLGQVLS